MAGPDDLYNYTPSSAAALVSVIAFGILFAVHTFRIFKTRTWFCIPFVLGALFEVIGFAGRAYGHSHPDNMGVFILQTVLILIAPILFAASIYMFLGRIIRTTRCESYSPIRVNWLTKLFVFGDILCFFIQATGASMLAQAKDNPSRADLGKKVVLFGLVLQILIFGVFVAVGSIFHKRMRSRGASKSGSVRLNWERYLGLLYLVSIIITVRNLFRVIEFAGGEDGYLMKNEWPIYVFDAALMAIVLAICVMWYVGDIVNEAYVQQEDIEIMVRGEPQ